MQGTQPDITLASKFFFFFYHVAGVHNRALPGVPRRFLPLANRSGGHTVTPSQAPPKVQLKSAFHFIISHSQRNFAKGMRGALITHTHIQQHKRHPPHTTPLLPLTTNPPGASVRGCDAVVAAPNHDPTSEGRRSLPACTSSASHSVSARRRLLATCLTAKCEAFHSITILYIYICVCIHVDWCSRTDSNRAVNVFIGSKRSFFSATLSISPCNPNHAWKHSVAFSNPYSNRRCRISSSFHYGRR
jgi:hypothetical protein